MTWVKTYIADSVEVAVDSVVEVTDGTGLTWCSDCAVDDLIWSCDNMVCGSKVENTLSVTVVTPFLP